jgi:DNA-binding response OmpR family regulator
MKRRILLVDDEVAVLLTLKAVLEISGFEVDTAASAREGKSKLRTREYNMVITDMRMESESAGEEVIAAARAAAYKPAIALLTAFPVNDENWQEGGADKLLVKPMQTRVLLQQIEQLFLSHEAKHGISTPAPAGVALAATANGTTAVRVARKAVANEAAAKKVAAKKQSTKAGPRELAEKAGKLSPKVAVRKTVVKKK